MGSAWAGSSRRSFPGCGHGGAVLAASAEDVEQELATGLREGHVPSSSTIQQADLGELVLEAEQPLLVARLDQFMDQMRGRGEAHAKALLAGSKDQGQSDVRLADA